MSSDSDSYSDVEHEYYKWQIYESGLDGGYSPAWVYALFVLDGSIPSTMINKVIRDAFDQKQGDELWLAEDYDSIDINCDDAPGQHRRAQRCTQVDADWTSPWAGKDIDEVIDFIRNAPNPPKALNKLFFVVLDKEEYETRGCLIVYKTVDGEAQSLPCRAPYISIFLDGHDRDEWPFMQEDWLDRGVVAMRWSR